MASTNFVNGVTLTDAGWFNDVDSVAYDNFGDGSSKTGNLIMASTKTITVDPNKLSLIRTGRCTADVDSNNTTTLADVTGLSFSIGANEEWVMTFNLLAVPVSDTWGNIGMKIGLNAPSGATIAVNATNTPVSTDLSTTSPVGGNSTSINTAFNIVFNGDSNTAIVRVNAWVLNGATPGTMVLRHACILAAGSGSIARVKKGSHMIAHRVA